MLCKIFANNDVKCKEGEMFIASGCHLNVNLEKSCHCLFDKACILDQKYSVQGH